MLKNIPSLLVPDALHALAAMGHANDVTIVDANFPAASVAREGGSRLVLLAGATSQQVLARKNGNIILRKGVISCYA